MSKLFSVITAEDWNRQLTVVFHPEIKKRDRFTQLQCPVGVTYILICHSPLKMIAGILSRGCSWREQRRNWQRGGNIKTGSQLICTLFWRRARVILQHATDVHAARTRVDTHPQIWSCRHEQMHARRYMARTDSSWLLLWVMTECDCISARGKEVNTSTSGKSMGNTHTHTNLITQDGDECGLILWLEFQVGGVRPSSQGYLLQAKGSAWWHPQIQWVHLFICREQNKPKKHSQKQYQLWISLRDIQKNARRTEND